MLIARAHLKEYLKVCPPKLEQSGIYNYIMKLVGPLKSGIARRHGTEAKLSQSHKKGLPVVKTLSQGTQTRWLPGSTRQNNDVEN